MEVGVRALRILGVDPGSQRTGFALAVFRGEDVVELDIGTWQVGGKLSREASLARLGDLAAERIATQKPDVAVVESLFHHKNARSLLVLAEARGVLLSVLGRLGVPVIEYPPATVKKTICGIGNADKDQVRRALLMTVPGVRRFNVEAEGLDATDALALAVTHHVRERFSSLTGASRR